MVRGYAAPFKTVEGRYIVSVNRARFCRDYFIQNYHVAASRISFEAYGAERTPEFATSDWVTHRCVELIIIGE
jgi:outer membrane protein OmpA-like peptidoglycan-associated protein